MSLINRFKEFRRPPKKRDISISKIKKSPKKKNPGITQTPRPPLFPVGEDTISLERHNRVLQAEFSKRATSRNNQVVSDLMDRTFPMRRKTILEQPLSLESIFEKFPFLQECEQVHIYTCMYMYLL